MTGFPSDLRAVARALGGDVVGHQVLAPGPGHSTKDRSLSVTLSATAPQGFLVYSHAGDDFTDCRDLVKANLGMAADGWRDDFHSVRRPIFAPAGGDDKTIVALRIWAQTVELRRTAAEGYLAVRGIMVGSTALRFHPLLKHPSGSRWPALVALVADGLTGKPIAIHRTFVTRNGNGKAPVEPAKMMLGPCRGGAVRLAEATDKLMIGEGIESTLSAMQATGVPAWASLSTAGMKTLALPPTVRDVVILADGDDAGERAAMQAARRWKAEGRRVRIARPPRGEDFNDIVRRHAPPIREVA
jgi:putative DNA primase/helicase